MVFSSIPAHKKMFEAGKKKNRDGSRSPAIYKMERFMTIVNGLKH